MPGNKYDRLDTKHISEGRHDEVMRNRSVYGDASGGMPVFLRYVILDVINDPSTIDKNKLSYYEHVLGVSNVQYAAVAPRNSIIARRVMGPGSSASEKVMVLFPFFPSHLSLPSKAGEHVWVMFENPDAASSEIGYWMCRIVQPHFVEDVNYTHADRQFDKSFLPGISDVFEGSDDPIYEFRNGAVDSKDGSRFTVGSTISLADPEPEKAYDKILKDSDAAKQTKYESVPRYRKRPGDFAFEGTNNTLIVLGTDRTGPVAEYDEDPDKGKVPKPVEDDLPAEEGTGMIDIVVGRGQTEDTGGKAVENSIGKKELGKDKKNVAKKEGDPDFKTDRSRVLIAQKTKADKNFKIDKVIKAHTKLNPVDEGAGAGFITVKTDKIRLVARQDLVILVTGAKEKDDKGNVKDTDASEAECASVIVRTNGDIIFTPSATGLIRMGGEDADLSPLCTRVSRVPGMPGPLPPPPPIVDTMGGAQGAADGLNGTFPLRVLLK